MSTSMLSREIQIEEWFPDWEDELQQSFPHTISSCDEWGLRVENPCWFVWTFRCKPWGKKKTLT
jgi:hypothetical protein